MRHLPAADGDVLEAGARVRGVYAVVIGVLRFARDVILGAIDRNRTGDFGCVIEVGARAVDDGAAGVLIKVDVRGLAGGIDAGDHTVDRRGGGRI